jgi:polysaccharide pyruvyl transferase WcaK-like protein
MKMEGLKKKFTENGHLSGSRQRVGVICISPSVERPEEIPFNQLYKVIGNNTGNLMFTQAIFRQLAGTVKKIGFSFNTNKINQNFDAIVIPAANWLNKYTDWDWFCNTLERIEIPIVTIGLGLQADSLSNSAVMVNQSSARLAKLLSQKSSFISTRGDFTRDWLNSIGIKNVVSTGCPSLYMKLVETDEKSDRDGIIIQSTRFHMSEKFLNNPSINQSLYHLSGKFGLDMIYQSEMEEIEYLVFGKEDSYILPDSLSNLVALYGFSNSSDYKSYLDVHGKVFFDINHWANFLKTHTGVIGTRLHGTILALNMGLPAILIPHDSRTAEVAEFAKLPTINLANRIDSLSEKAMLDLLKESNVEEYLTARQLNLKVYLEFLASNNLEVDMKGFLM